MKHLGGIFLYQDGLMGLLTNDRFHKRNTDAFVVLKTNETGTVVIKIQIENSTILGTNKASMYRFNSDSCAKWKEKRFYRPLYSLPGLEHHIGNRWCHTIKSTKNLISKDTQSRLCTGDGEHTAYDNGIGLHSPSFEDIPRTDIIDLY